MSLSLSFRLSQDARCIMIVIVRLMADCVAGVSFNRESILASKCAELVCYPISSNSATGAADWASILE